MMRGRRTSCSSVYNGIGLSSASTSLPFTITFDATINSILRLNRFTGFSEVINLNNHVLNVTLPGGTADLFKYNTGAFAGLPGGRIVPESATAFPLILIWLGRRRRN
jgi:hypothetical protein